MRNLKYILMLVTGMGLLTSCFDEDTALDLNDDGPNVVTFDRVNSNLTVTANGDIYYFRVPIKLVGPSSMDETGDLTVTLTAAGNSTAVEGQHYQITNSPLTLSKSNNYLGLVDITLISEGNSPPKEGTPEWDAYSPPMLYVEITVSGGRNVVGSGKGGVFTLNFTAPNPYKGDYDTEMRYFHPTAGGSHPSLGDAFDPNDPYGGVRNAEKTLAAVTGKKCETTFAVWEDLCWITVNNDGSILYEVDDTWTYDVKPGNPFDPSQVSNFDEDTRVISLYYHYSGAGGDRVFWEIFTPKF